MSKNKYNFKQAELYTIARFILALVAQPNNLARFAAFKGKYTNSWISDRLKDVDLAEDAPDEQTRNAVHESLRITLLELVQQSLDKFNALERYIIEVYSEAQQKPAIEAAGGSYYTAASDSDFDACQQMLNSSFNFVTENETLLLQGGDNMPATFRTELETLGAVFSSKHTAFIESEGDAEVLTGEKIMMNNAVYTQIVTGINADAQALFTEKTDEDIRKQFVLEHQLFLVRGAGVAGMRFHVTDASTTADLAEATVLIPAKDFTGQTDEGGRLLKLQIAEGEYVIKVMKAGYVSYEKTVKIETGTVKRINVALVPV